MKGSTIEYYYGGLVRKKIPFKNYDSIFNLRRHSNHITKNKFRLSRNNYNAMRLYFSLKQRSDNDHVNSLYNHFHNYKNTPIFNYSVCKFKDHALKELRMAKDYFDKNYWRG